MLSSCIDVFDYFARTLVPPTLSKLQNNPDISHEEFKVCAKTQSLLKLLLVVYCLEYRRAKLRINRLTLWLATQKKISKYSDTSGWHTPWEICASWSRGEITSIFNVASCALLLQTVPPTIWKGTSVRFVYISLCTLPAICALYVHTKGLSLLHAPSPPTCPYACVDLSTSDKQSWCVNIF